MESKRKKSSFFSKLRDCHVDPDLSITMFRNRATQFIKITYVDKVKISGGGPRRIGGGRGGGVKIKKCS
jgi:hypothetical protein